MPWIESTKGGPEITQLLFDERCDRQHFSFATSANISCAHLTCAICGRHIFNPLGKCSLQLISGSRRGRGRLGSLFHFPAKSSRLLDDCWVGSRIVGFKIGGHIGTVDPLLERLETFGSIGLAEENQALIAWRILDCRSTLHIAGDGRRLGRRLSQP